MERKVLLLIYVVTYKVPGYETRPRSLHLTVCAAKAAAERLDAETGALTAGITMLELERPREWTEEQRRWMRGTP